MSTYVLMKILESAPRRYDAGIRLLTLGRLDKAYNRLADHLREGQQVLDLGCGTGALTIRAARKGAVVKGIDINPEMLDIARKRAAAAGVKERVQLAEMGVAELGEEAAGSRDAIISGLCFSELSEDEQRYALKEAARILKPGGLLLIADESRPEGFLQRLLIGLIRIPLVIITYLATQTTTHSVKDLPGKIEAAGFAIVSLERSRLKDFNLLMAQKPGGEKHG